MSARFDHGYALLIGVGQVPGWDEMSLTQSVADVRAIREILVDPGRCAYPDSDDHICLIHDEGATRAGIPGGLAWLMGRVDRDPLATAVIYYSGHGLLDTNSNSYFLIPHEAERSNVAGTAVAFRIFAAELSKISAPRRLVVLDCCHASAIHGAKGGARRGTPSGVRSATAPLALLDQLKQGKGHAVFCSSDEEESSRVFKGKNISIFTYHFTEALRGAASKTNEIVVNVSQLMNHVGRKVPRSARDHWEASQNPFFLFETQEYPVALLRGGKGLPSSSDILRRMASSRELSSEFGDYPELARAYLSPWSVFERVKPERFTGRKWLENRLDHLLSENDRGLFIVEAEAGLGKTAFLAQLVRERGYVHHFVEIVPGSDGILPGIRSLAAQLIRAWDLPTTALDGIAPGYTIRPDYLQNLLKQAADRRDVVRPDEKIVLVVDALDEAGPPTADQNVLGLPRVLPKGVYFVVSQRPVKYVETYGARPKRPAWFACGKGRALVGYSERLYFIPNDVHAQLQVRDLPMADQNKVNNLFGDMLGVNARLRGQRRKLAIELANLCASKDTLLECLMPTSQKPCQYLLPVRSSVLTDAQPLSKAPLYKDLGKLLDASTNPRTFRIGPEYRDWLELNKRLIQSRLFE
jgi:uncharacterized caspase-like protein